MPQMMVPRRRSWGGNFIRLATSLALGVVWLVSASSVAAATSDVAKGKDLFWGSKQFANGGPACAACHDIAGADGLGGGRLGPDLTAAAYVPPTDSIPKISPTMGPIFGPDSGGELTKGEVAALTAYLTDAAAKASPARKKQAQSFNQSQRGSVYTDLLLYGFIGLVVLLPLSTFVIRRRKGAVRRDLVESRKIENRK